MTCYFIEDVIIYWQWHTARLPSFFFLSFCRFLIWFIRVTHIQNANNLGLRQSMHKSTHSNENSQLGICALSIFRWRLVFGRVLANFYGLSTDIGLFELKFCSTNFTFVKLQSNSRRHSLYLPLQKYSQTSFHLVNIRTERLRSTS